MTTQTPQPLLNTERLTLRPTTGADAEVLANLVNNFEISKWLTKVAYPNTLAETQAYLRDTAAELWRFGIVRREDDALMGVIAIGAQLGYWLGEPYWGHGYMSEAARAVVDAWFEAGGDPLASSYFTENTKSRAILTGLGFKNTEPGTSFSKARGGEVPSQKLALTHAAWLAQRATSQSN